MGELPADKVSDPARAKSEDTKVSTQVLAASYLDDIVRLIADDADARKQTAELVRYIGFALVAFFVATVSSETRFAKTLVTDGGILFQIAGLCGCLTIALDYAYLLTKNTAQRRLLRAIHRKDPNVKVSVEGRYLYDETDPFYRIAPYLFFGSHFLAASGCVAAILIFFVALGVPPPEASG